MSDVFREVDEEVRQDRIALALTRNWGWILLAALLIVAGDGSWRIYEYYTVQNEEASGGHYLDALRLDRDGKTGEAKTVLDELGRSGTPGYALLARFRSAAQLGASNAADGAKAFDALAADPKVDAALQDVARLRAATLLLDTSDLKATQARLQSLADANSAMRNPARELLALAAIKADDFAAAGPPLDAILADPTAPMSTRQRAQALLGLVRSGTATPAKP